MKLNIQRFSSLQDVVKGLAKIFIAFPFWFFVVVVIVASPWCWNHALHHANPLPATSSKSKQWSNHSLQSTSHSCHPCPPNIPATDQD